MKPELPRETSADAANDPAAPSRGPRRWLFRFGAVALLGAMAVDALAVVGRHTGRPLLGSIELVQAAMLMASSAAIVSATLAEKHAVVHLVIDRLGPGVRAILLRIHAALCMIFFAALTAGSVWIFYDLRDGYEESELLRIPYAPLRAISILAVLSAAAIYAARVGAGRRSVPRVGKRRPTR
jgi:TRAP-type C4-dicarboxylate transport system permease small subunit